MREFWVFLLSENGFDNFRTMKNGLTGMSLGFFFVIIYNDNAKSGSTLT